MVSLFNGSLHLWNYDTQQMVKSFEVGDVPVRCAIFVVRKNWIVAGAVRLISLSSQKNVTRFLKAQSMPKIPNVKVTRN